MTRNNTKLRAVLLAALMVLWVFAGTVAFAGSAAAQSNIQEARELGDDTWQNDTTRWQGQSLYFEPADNPENHSYVLRNYDSSNSEPVQDAIGPIAFDQADDGSYYALIDTSNFEGEVVITKDGKTNTDVVLTGADGIEDGLNTNDSKQGTEFFVQQVDASFNPDTVGEDGSTQLELSSGRTAAYNLTISSDNLTKGQIQALFSNATYPETSNGIEVSSKSNLTADFSQVDVESGDYTFDVEVTDTTASDSATVSVDPAAAADANFDQSVFAQERGDNATISLTTESLDQFNLTVGNSEDVNYEANLVVQPNENGEVVIQMNTYAAGGHSGATVNEVYTAVEGDIVESHNATERVTESNSRPLEAGLYDVIAQNPNTEYDIAALDLKTRSTGAATVHTAPDYSGVSTKAEVYSGLQDGSITESDEIALQDAMIVQVEASGIYSQLGAQSSPTAYLNDSSTDFDLTIEQSNPGVNQDPHRVNIDQSQSRVIQDAENDTFFVVFSSTGLNTDQNRSVKAGDEFDVTFEVSDTYAYNDAAESVNDSFSLAQRTASFDTQGGMVVVPSSEDAEISGTTSVAPGTEFTIRARATGENPFLKTGSATVTEDGTFSTTFDFSNVAEGQNFSVSIPNQGFADNAQTDARVGDTEQAAVSLSDVSATEGEEVSSITVDSVFVPQGGFVTIHDGSLLDGATFDSVRGTSDYLSEGEHSDVEVSLDTPYTEDGDAIAMPHKDTNGNEAYDFVDSEGSDDGPYTDENDDAIVDSASVTFEPDETPTETEEPETETETETDEDTETETDSEEQAGFGAVIALIALLGAALLAARRNAF